MSGFNLISISRTSFNSVQMVCSRFSKLTKINPNKLTSDALSSEKALKNAEILRLYTPLRYKKVLEVGSGFGVNLIIWSKHFEIDGYGLEPDSEGFESSYKISRALAIENGLDENRVINATGEKIPFPDNYFDIVFSTNVLEHTKDPYQVLKESLRVLKPGGVMQFIYPNYHSCFEGHYAVFVPPFVSYKTLKTILRCFYNRDTHFLKTLRTELNVIWTCSTLNKLRKYHNFELLTLGEDIFFERMINLNFEEWAGLYKVKKLLLITKRAGLNYILAKTLFALKLFTPIILTLKKI